MNDLRRPPDLSHLLEADLAHAVNIAERVWWVGEVLADDSFQCHAYLIEQGDQSVLLDPGSRLTFPGTLCKIEEVIPFSQVRYFVCHHPDPDITSALPLIDELLTRDDALIITHWRSQALIKHYGLRAGFWLVEDHDWRLPLVDRELQFIFTPYAHFPGAICSFDDKSRVLFASDLFGGLTDGAMLVARDETYFEAMRPFHEHYMPSRDVLDYAISQIERKPVELVAPQHGSIIPPHLVRPMIEKLRHLECGIYLSAQGDTDIRRLSRLNQTLRDITQTLLLYRDFREIAARLLDVVAQSLPAERIDYYAKLDDGRALTLSPETRFSGVVDATLPRDISTLLGRSRQEWLRAHRDDPRLARHQIYAGQFCRRRDNDGRAVLTLPLFSPDEDRVVAAAVIRLQDDIAITRQVEQVIEQLAMPLQVAIEREVIYRSIDEERAKAYQRSIRDPLTGLFTRSYMQEVMQRHCAIHDRDIDAPVAAIILDIDHFKSINDQYGHASGDLVLKRVARLMREHGRETDVQVRLGGEEFVIFLIGASARQAAIAARRLHEAIASHPFAPDGASSIPVTASLGVALRQQGEALDVLIRRADEALYRAKKDGRNRIELSAELAAIDQGLSNSAQTSD